MIRQSLDVRNWEAAVKIVREWEIHGIAESVTLPDAYDRYLVDLEANKKAVDTLQKHRHMRKLRVEIFGDIPLRKITVDDLDRFKHSWKLSPTTTVNTINRVRMFFNFCLKRDWIEKSPARHLTGPKIDEIERKPCEPAELEKIWEAVDHFPNWGI